MTPSFDLRAAPAHALESFHDLKAIERALRDSEPAGQGWPDETLLGKLVVPYMARTVRLVAAPAQHRAELEAFAGHLGRIVAPASVQRAPTHLGAHYEQLNIARKFALEGYRLKTRQTDRQVDAATGSGAYNTHWRDIAAFLLAAKDQGRKQQAITEFLASKHNGKAYTAGAISQMLGSMRSAGWIHTSLQGRTNVHFPGEYVLANADLFAAKSTISQELETVLDALCSLQGRIAQFNWSSNDLHKGFREATSAALECLDTPPGSNATASELSQEQITARVDLIKSAPALLSLFLERKKKIIETSVALNHYMDGATRQACEFSFKYMQRYFLQRGATSSPRIALKGFFPTPGEDTPVRRVTTFHGTSAKSRPPSDLDKSSTFSEVLRTGVFKLIPDIPQATYDGFYNSSRFEKWRVDRYRDDPVAYPFETCFSDYDEQVRSGVSSRNFYKSSLVVPVSMMLNDGMDKNFVTQWQKRFIETAGKPVTEGRLVFGFVCVDHTDANFFLPGNANNLDVRMTYYFADLLSLYLFQRATLTSASQHFKWARWILGKNEEAQLRTEYRVENAPLGLTRDDLPKLNKELQSPYDRQEGPTGAVNDDALRLVSTG